MPSKKKKSSRSRGSVGEFYDYQKTFLFNRTNGGTSAQLKFFAKKPSFCEIRLWSADAKSGPQKSEAKIVDCENKQAKIDFVETIDDLSTSFLYVVEIKFFADKSTKRPFELVGPIYEPKSRDIDSSGGSTTGFESLYYLRFNQPLRIAEVHKHRFETPKAASSITEELKRETGCKRGLSENLLSLNTSTDFDLDDFHTNKFAAAISDIHPNHLDRRILTYDETSDEESDWIINFKHNTNNESFSVRPGNKLVEIEFVSKNRKVIDDNQLLSNSDALTLDGEKDLNISWSYKGNLSSDYSYITIQIGQQNDSPIHCTFEANKGSASIERALLNALGQGNHDVLVQLEMSQFWARESFLVAMVDWRFGRVFKP